MYALKIKISLRFLLIGDEIEGMGMTLVYRVMLSIHLIPLAAIILREEGVGPFR